VSGQPSDGDAPAGDPDGGLGVEGGRLPSGDAWLPANGGPADSPTRGGRRIPEATVARLPVYLRSLVEVAESKTATISSERLAEMAGVNAAKVRKDLSYLGSYGTRGVGYDVEYLLFQINRVLGLTQHWPVVIVGIGNLGHALANYRGFSARGFRIAALVDADRSKVGEVLSGLSVRPIDDLPVIAREEGLAIGIIATPAGAAQDVADRLVAAGVRSILNFAPAVINVPPGVFLRKVDLSIELQILAFYQQRGVRDGLGEIPPEVVAG
jgi:redox-sensing transcriptional repressor